MGRASADEASPTEVTPDGPENPPRRPDRRGRTERNKRKDYLGCALWMLAFLAVGIGGCAAGLALRPDGGPEDTERVTVARGGSGVSTYELVARTDETGDPCVTLVAGDDDITGQCGYSISGEDNSRYAATSTRRGDLTIIFGPVPDEVAKVRLRLEDGTRPVVSTQEGESLPGRFFVYEASSPDKGPTELLDESGDPVEIPR